MAGGWLSGIGAALQQGSHDYRKAKAYEDEQQLIADREARDKERERVQLALMQSSETRAERGEKRANELHERDLVKESLQFAAPDAALDKDLATRARNTGLGHMVGERDADDGLFGQRFTMDAEGNYIQQAAPREDFRQATFSEKRYLDEDARTKELHEKQQFAQQLLNSPQFEALDVNSRQKIWSQAGMPGRVEENFAERKKLMDYQHGLEMRKINTMYPPERFNDDGKNNAVNVRNFFNQIITTEREARRQAAQAGKPYVEVTTADIQQALTVAQQMAAALEGKVAPGAPPPTEEVAVDDPTSMMGVFAKSKTFGGQ